MSHDAIAATVITQFKKLIPQKQFEIMSLCIANRDGENVQFWSDSRLNFYGSLPIDLTIKVISFPIKIYDSKNKIKPVFETNWGLCFAGGSNTIYYIKDFIVENLKELEFNENLFELSAEKIASYIDKIYSIACNEYMTKIDPRQGACILITTGLCPQTKKFICYEHSFIQPFTDKVETTYTEILKNDKEIRFIGSGDVKAKMLYDNGIKHPYDIMKEVINSDEVSTVGGEIQFGETKYTDFKIKGVLNSDGDTTKAQLRGVDIYGDIFDYRTDLHPLRSYIYKK